MIRQCVGAPSARHAAWLVLRIRARVLLWRLRWPLVVLLAIVASRGIQGALYPRHAPRTALPSGSSVGANASGTSLVEAGWTASRARLEGAHVLRREGHASDAIRAYSTVIAASAARLQDVQSARAWRARLCFERGEASALDELMALAHDHLPPQLYAHVASTVTSQNSARNFADSSVTRRAVFEAVIQQLERACRVRGASGVRARGWLQRVRTRGASFFSR